MYGHEYDERDPEAEARSVAAVREWYTKMAMCQTRTDLNGMGSNSIHPAFRERQDVDAGRGGYDAPSAVLEPLRLKKDVYTPARTHWPQPGHDVVHAISPGLDECETRTEWTDATVYTTGSGSSGANVNLGNAPPLLQIPSQYQRQNYSTRDRLSTGNHSIDQMSAPSLTHSGNTRSSRSSPAPTAPGLGPAPPRPPQTKQDRRKYLFRDNDSDVASRLTETNRNYLRAHRGMRDVNPGENPFVRSDSVRSQRSRGETVQSSAAGSRSGTLQQRAPLDGGDSGDSGGRNGRPQFEGHTSRNAEAEKHAHGQEQQPRPRPDAGGPARIPSARGYCHGYGTPPERRASSRPVDPGAATGLDAQEAEWREGWLQPDLKPDDSASNVGWKTQGEIRPPPPPPPPAPRKRPSHDVTTLGYFLNRGDKS
jgi:hypothetical protein